MIPHEIVRENHELFIDLEFGDKFIDAFKEHAGYVGSGL